MEQFLKKIREADRKKVWDDINPLLGMVTAKFGTKVAAAAKLSVSRSHIHLIARRKRSPSKELIERIKAVLKEQNGIPKNR
jgi:hypothetical protein